MLCSERVRNVKLTNIYMKRKKRRRLDLYFYEKDI